MHQKKLVAAGQDLATASKVLIILHGRGGSAEDILGLADHLGVKDFALIAPEATNHTWYPYSFMAPVGSNEPWLTSALLLLKEITIDLESKGIEKENMYFLGFSQGACLTLEFVARNAARYGGVVAFTGGLIGENINRANYNGDFGGTPIFIGSSDPDMHVPVQRVEDSATLLEKMNAAVTKKIYKGMGHTISKEEIDEVNRLIF